MSNRPAIPAEVTREILLESGHRCAVCGTPCPLERAHIIPWRKSKEHKAEDLICLCANCHERADKENWGAKTLREYKSRPWVLRQYRVASDSAPPEPRTRLQIIIDVELALFGERNQKWLQYAVAAFLDISPSAVQIVSVEPGSVRVTVELPADRARELVAACARHDPKLMRSLAPLILIEIREEVETSSIATVSTTKPPVILIVEDERLWRNKLTRWLRSEGYIARTAASYGEALGRLRQSEFDLVIVDLGLRPGEESLDGMDLLDDAAQRQICAIVVTGRGTAQTAKCAYEDYDVFQFLEKASLDRERFVIVVREAVFGSEVEVASAIHLDERIIAQIRELVSQDLLEQALEKLSSAEACERDVAQLSRRLARIRRQMRKGTMTQSEAEAERARVADAILDLISPEDG